MKNNDSDSNHSNRHSNQPYQAYEDDDRSDQSKQNNQNNCNNQVNTQGPPENNGKEDPQSSSASSSSQSSDSPTSKASTYTEEFPYENGHKGNSETEPTQENESHPHEPNSQKEEYSSSQKKHEHLDSNNWESAANHSPHNSRNEKSQDKLAHKKALQEALTLLGDLNDSTSKNSSNFRKGSPEFRSAKQAMNQASLAGEKCAINYQAVVETELKNLTDTVYKLQQENLENIAKIQTMARRHGEAEVQTRKYGGAKLAQEIIPTLDLFKKILQMPVKNEEIKNYLLGFEMIAKQLDQVLTNNGIRQIEVKIGDEFDPQLHEATELVETSEVPSGKIVTINSNGYKLHDRVIKHTSVKVAK